MRSNYLFVLSLLPPTTCDSRLSESRAQLGYPVCGSSLFLTLYCSTCVFIRQLHSLNSIPLSLVSLELIPLAISYSIVDRRSSILIGIIYRILLRLMSILPPLLSLWIMSSLQNGFSMEQQTTTASTSSFLLSSKDSYVSLSFWFKSQRLFWSWTGEIAQD